MKGKNSRDPLPEIPLGGQHPLVDDDVAARVADLLKEHMDWASPTGESKVYTKEERARLGEIAGEFASAAATILAFILSREISHSRKDRLVHSFFSACFASHEVRHLSGDVIERLQDELRAIGRQRSKELTKRNSAKIDEIIRRHADGLKNATLRKSKSATARAIKVTVNAELGAADLKPLTERAIRRRL